MSVEIINLKTTICVGKDPLNESGKMTDKQKESYWNEFMTEVEEETKKYKVKMKEILKDYPLIVLLHD